MMRILKYLGILIALAALVVFVMGYRLPEAHTASVERDFAAAPGRVYAEISNPGEFSKWRSGVQRVVILPPDSATGRSRFREISLSDETTYEVEQEIPDRLFVTRIADEGLPYGGTWTFELEPTANGTMLRITEDGEVYNPVFRFVSRYVIGHQSGIEKYMDDLEKRLAVAQP